MNPVSLVTLLWLLFGGSHLLLSSPPARGALVRRFGERRFVLLYSLFSTLSFTALVLAFGLYGHGGPPGLGWGHLPPGNWILVAINFLGAMLMMGGLLGYFGSPMAVFRTELKAPRGIGKITRHPFFVGIGLLMAAHALRAPTLAGLVFFGGFAVLSVGGIVLQDRKLLQKYGEPYARYRESTSVLPFLAILRGRQTLGAGDRRWQLLLLSAAGALALVVLHPLWRMAHSLPIALLISGGGLYIVARRWTLPPAAATFSPPASPSGH